MPKMKTHKGAARRFRKTAKGKFKMNRPFADHIKTTEELLLKLDLEQTPRLIVCNKADRVDPRAASALARETRGVVLSAIDRDTFGPLLERMEGLLFHPKGERFDKRPSHAAE